MKLVLSFCGLVAAVQVRSPANIKIGEQIGALLSNGISKDPAGFNSAFNAAISNFPVVSNEAVEAVARNHVKNSAFLDVSRDYSSCPVGWIVQGDLCVAPEGFFGCSRRFNRKLMNDHMKQKFAENCSVEFPASFVQKFWDPETVHPILNLHVKESGSDASTNAAVEASQRAQLAALEAEEAQTKEVLADMLGRVSTGLEAAAKKVSSKQTSFLGIISDVQREGEGLAHLRQELTSMRSRLAKGGYPAYNALVHLLNLASEPNAQNVMFLQFTGKALADLMRKESTPDSLRNLAGSVLTQISNAPVSTMTSDFEGGAGHVNIVVPRPSRVYSPDAAVLALRAGADAVDVA